MARKYTFGLSFEQKVQKHCYISDILQDKYFYLIYGVHYDSKTQN